MPKIVSKARLLRLQHQVKLGRQVQMKEVAETIGVTEATLSKIERGQTERIDFETLQKLCSYYGVGVGDILEYDPIKEPLYSPQLNKAETRVQGFSLLALAHRQVDQRSHILPGP